MSDMGYVESLTGFEEHFISGMSQDAELDFLDSNIVFLEESVFRPVVDILMQGSGSIVVGSKRDIVDIDCSISISGPFWSGEPSLACDCSFYWIVKERAVLDVFDRSPGTYNSPRCYDGTLLADLDVEIFDDLCPQLGF